MEGTDKTRVVGKAEASPARPLIAHEVISFDGCSILAEPQGGQELSRAVDYLGSGFCSLIPS